MEVKVNSSQHNTQLLFTGGLVFEIIHSEHTDAAAVGARHVEDRLQRSAFSRSVFSNKAHDFTFVQ